MPGDPPQSSVTSLAPRSRRVPWAALGLVGALVCFAWGLVHLFELRFAGGDVYPAYSTLRRDPLGAAAFHDALAALPNLRVERNLRPLAALDRPTQLRPDQPGAPAHPAGSTGEPPVLFYLGADAYEWPYLFRHDVYARLDAIMRQGGRVVITFLPGQTPLTGKRRDKLRQDQSDDPGSSPSEKSSPHPPKSSHRERPAAARLEDLIARWAIDFRRVDQPAAGRSSHPSAGAAKSDDARDARPVMSDPPDGAGAISWHSVLDFDLRSPEAQSAGWQALYRRGVRPVVIERPVGDRGGTLILASDSYFLSNEALRSERRPALLAGLIGSSRRVIFDETHLGVAEEPGMMTLARHYGLQGGLAALGLLAVLFIWRNVVSLVPPAVVAAESASPTTGGLLGRDAAAGFLNLLRRGIPPRDLLATCLEQWRHTPNARPPDAATTARLEEVAADEAARPANRRSPATAYRAMCAAVRARR